MVPAPAAGDAAAFKLLAADGTWRAPSWFSGAVDHGTLTGLADDDHTQYLLLAGRAGGQTAYGGTAASENLNLNATSHATKGTVTITGLYEKIAAGDTLWVDATNRNAFYGSSNPGNVGTSSGTDNVAIGDNALGSATTAINFVAVGKDAASAVTAAAAGGVAVGYQAAKSATTFSESVVAGVNAGAVATNISGSVFIGQAAGYLGAISSIAIGPYAGLAANASSVGYVFIGSEVSSNGGGTAVNDYSIGIGYRALYDADGAENVIAIGRLAGQNVTSGDGSVLLGGNVAPTLTTGGNNVVIASNANTLGDVPASGSSSYLVLAASESIAVVDPTLRSVHLGSGNPGNWTIASGTDCVFIGDNAGGSISNASLTVAIGRNAALSSNPADAVVIGAVAGQNATGTQVDSATLIGRGAAPSGGQYATVVGAWAAYGAPALSNYIAAVGAHALYDSSGATGTSAFGAYAGQNVTSGAYNLLAGFNVAPTLTTGTNNIVLGAYEDTAVYADVTASGAKGQIIIAAEGENEALNPVSVHIVVMPSTGGGGVTDGNTFVGSRTGNWRAGIVAGGGYNNAMFGPSNGVALTSGNTNLFLGQSNGLSATTASNCILIGSNQNVPAAGTTYYMSLGGLLFGDLSNYKARFGGSGAVSQTERVAITQATDDTSEVFSIETTSTNGAKSRFYVGDQSPNGTITADPGSMYFRVNGTSSSAWVNTGAGSGTTWTDLNGAAGSGLTHPQVMARTFFGW